MDTPIYIYSVSYGLEIDLNGDDAVLKLCSSPCWRGTQRARWLMRGSGMYGGASDKLKFSKIDKRLYLRVRCRCFDCRFEGVPRRTFHELYECVQIATNTTSYYSFRSSAAIGVLFGGLTSIIGFSFVASYHNAVGI